MLCEFVRRSSASCCYLMARDFWQPNCTTLRLTTETYSKKDLLFPDQIQVWGDSSRAKRPYTFTTLCREVFIPNAILSALPRLTYCRPGPFLPCQCLRTPNL